MSDTSNKKDWEKDHWEIFEHADILHDAEHIYKDNKLFLTCLKELGFIDTNSTNKYSNQSVKFVTTPDSNSNPNVDFITYSFEKKNLHEMRDLIDFNVIKYFFIDNSHKSGSPSYSGNPIPMHLSIHERQNYTSYFDYSIIKDKQLAETSHKATTANITDPASTPVLLEQVIDENGTEIKYNVESNDYYGFPNGVEVKTKIIKEGSKYDTGCYIYVHYNSNPKLTDKNYNFSAYYRINLEEDKFPLDTTHAVAYNRVEKDAGDEIFDQRTGEIFKPVNNPKILLSNQQKEIFFNHSKSIDSEVLIKQGMEYIVLKALGDRNQTSFLKKK